MVIPPNRATASAAISPGPSPATWPGSVPGGVTEGLGGGAAVGGRLPSGEADGLRGGSVGGGGPVGVDVGEVVMRGDAGAAGLVLGDLLGLAVAMGPGVTSGTTAVVKFAQRYSRWVRPEARICAASSRPT